MREVPGKELAAALKDLFPERGKRDAVWKRPEPMINGGKAKEVVDELELQAERHEKVEEFVNDCKRGICIG